MLNRCWTWEFREGNRADIKPSHTKLTFFKEKQKMANVPALLQVVGILTLYPERHNQGVWHQVPGGKALTREEILETDGCNTSCKTAGCFAGWAAIELSPEGSVFSPHYDMSVFIPDPSGIYYRYERYPHTINGLADSYEYVPLARRLRKETVYDYAQHVLELTDNQANYMFSSIRTLGQLFDAVRSIISNPDAYFFD
jgi:hypothetical protein